MPIDYTSDESRQKNREEANFLYARYALLGIIGSLIFLTFSFGGGLFYVAPTFICVAILAIVELRRSDREEARKEAEKTS
jgi:hypothetical protein